MSYEVLLSMEAVEDVLRITMASGSKSEIVNASTQIQEALRSDPVAAGEHLSEGLYQWGVASMAFPVWRRGRGYEASNFSTRAVLRDAPPSLGN